MITRRLLRLLLLVTGGLLVIGVLGGIQPFPSHAQHEARYFPETGHSIQGPFRAFWEQQGGADIFGYPITEEYISETSGRTVQYFERARFELVLHQGQPYVELGRLGVEITAGRIFPAVPALPNTSDWRYFPETGHVIQKGFKEIWETRGGERIFGLPISEETLELFPDGKFRTVQYFERARFEYWPEFPPGQRVLFSDLGRQLAPPALTTPLAAGSVPAPHGGGGYPTMTPAMPQQPSPTPTTPLPATTSPYTPTQPTPSAAISSPPYPAYETTSKPPNVNAVVSPDVGPPGERFTFQAYGFEKYEQVGIWLTAPDHTTIDSDMPARADEDGSIAHEHISIKTKTGFMDGIWSINAQGLKSGNHAVAYFRISRAIVAAPGNPAHLGVLVHDRLAVETTSFVVPLAAPAGTSFTFIAQGYNSGELVSGWLTSSDGKSTSLDIESLQVDSHGLVQIRFATEELPPGTYVVVAKGRESGDVRSAPFILTNSYVAGPGTPLPPDVNGRATPREGGLGTIFSLRGNNLQAGESVEFWMTDPTGAYTYIPEPMIADEQGRVGYTPPLDMYAGPEFSPGVYGFHFRGKSSGQRVDVYFAYNETL